MIASMKRVFLFCLAHDREKTLTALREQGVLHVEPVREPRGADLDEARHAFERVHAALAFLPEHVHGHDAAEPDVSRLSANEVVERVTSRLERRRELSGEIDDLLRDVQRIEPFGNVEPETLAALADGGLTVHFCRVPLHIPLPDLSNTLCLPAATDASSQYLVLVGTGDLPCDAAHTMAPPERSLNALRDEIDARRTELDAIERELKNLGYHRRAVAQLVTAHEEALELARTREGMETAQTVAYLSGYCPEDALPALRERARAEAWGLLIRDPEPDETVPTLIRYPRFVKPIKAVFDGLAILPGYRESDISAVFLVFFSIFFAILIGDAGYGLLFLLTTLWARRKFPKAPAYPFILFGLLSACTILWGVVTGNYFGISPDALPALLRGLRLDWLAGESARDHVIRLCFLIGAVHLTVAHTWNAAVLFPAPKAFAQAGWIGLVWSMYFLAVNMVLRAPLPHGYLVLVIASMALILIFMTAPKDFKNEWINHAMFPLSVVSCFVDVVSYIRLFAVGLAGLSVAQSFNNMAMQVGWSRIWTVPLAALILLLGHGLNILLCALGILVHGVRLNTLEFSLHKGIEWKGRPYRPFARIAPRTGGSGNA